MSRIVLIPEDAPMVPKVSVTRAEVDLMFDPWLAAELIRQGHLKPVVSKLKRHRYDAGDVMAVWDKIKAGEVVL